MDLLASFIEQCITIDYTCDEKIQASELFSIYSRWAKQNNEWEMSSKKFFRDISLKLPDKGRNNRGIFYTKIKPTEYALSITGPATRQYKFEDFTD